jgi:Arc/MetJ-type ribon-helix-helix transcriptional regulator
MAVELKPETEQLVQQEIESGHFRNIDELIVEGMRAVREQSKARPAIAKPRTPRKNLFDFLSASPFAGSEINLERQQDYGRPIDL